MDLKEFGVFKEGEKIIFNIEMGNIENPWSGPWGMSLPVIDVYIDVNHRMGTGNVSLLPGRGAYTLPEDAWEYALTVDGWNREIYRMGREDEPIKMASTFDVNVDTYNAVLTMSIPSSILRGDPKNWGYIVLSMGYDSSSPDRIRKVYKESSNKYFGGGVSNGSSPPIIDLLAPPGISQKEILSAFQRKRVVEIPAVRFIQP